MPAATRPNPARNARFGVLHAARDAGDSALTLTGAYEAATPKARLIDDQAGRPLVATTNTGVREVLLDRGQHDVREGTDRTIIAGHNFDAESTVTEYRTAANSSMTSADRILYQADLSTVDLPLDCGSIGLYDIEYRQLGAAALAPNQYHEVLLEDGTTNPVRMGELWATRMLTPSSGHSTEWSIDPGGNVAITRSISGKTYATKLGEPQRRWTLRHESCSDADRREVYGRLDRAYANGQPVIYDPPESGDHRYIRFQMEQGTTAGAQWQDLSGSSTSVIALASQRDPWHADVNTEHGMRVTTNGLGTYAQGPGHDNATTRTAHGLTGESWAGLHITLDLRWPVGETTTWVTANRSVCIEIESNTDNAKYSRFGLAQCVINSGIATDVWYRIWLDPNTQAPFLTGSSGPADLTDVTGVRLLMEPDVAVRKLDFAKFTLVDPTKGPRIVEILSPPTYRQVADSPSSDPEWDVDLEILELLT